MYIKLCNSIVMVTKTKFLQRSFFFAFLDREETLFSGVLSEKLAELGSIEAAQDVLVLLFLSTGSSRSKVEYEEKEQEAVVEMIVSFDSCLDLDQVEEWAIYDCVECRIVATMEFAAESRIEAAV